MMINFVIVLAIMALAAWLGNLLMAVEAAVAHTRARIRSAKDSVARLEGVLKRLKREEEGILKEIEETGNAMFEVRSRHADAQQRLADAQAKRRPRLLILTDRRNASDKEWIVVVANPQIMEIDASHPLATEWQHGREYLVWAESEREAAGRVQRRFSARPGFSVRSVAAVTEDLYANSRVVGASR